MLHNIKSLTFREGNTTFTADQLHPGVFTIGMSQGYSNVVAKQIEEWLMGDTVTLISATKDATAELQQLINGDSNEIK